MLLKLLLFYLIGKDSTKWSLYSLFSLNNIPFSLRFLSLCPFVCCLFLYENVFFLWKWRHFLSSRQTVRSRDGPTEVHCFGDSRWQWIRFTTGRMFILVAKQTTTHSIIVVNGPYMKTWKQKGAGLLCLFPPAVSCTTGHLTKCITHNYLIHWIDARCEICSAFEDVWLYTVAVLNWSLPFHV